jgi:parallel beta-helix repeat protein
MKEREKIDLKNLGGEKEKKMRSEKRVKFGKRKALVFVALFAVFVSLSIGTASAATHYVHPGESIQDAIDAASSSDTIEVYSGTYYENVDVTKQLVLRGVDTDTGKPIVDASGNGSTIILSADGIVLEGFEVTNSTGWLEAGIRIMSENNIVRDINATNNDYGIILYFSSNNTLKDNLMSGNGYNFGVWAANDNDIDTSNLVDGKPIYYLVGASDMVIDSSSNAGTVYCIDCDNITVIGLTLTKNSDGVYFHNTCNSRIENNQISSNLFGIGLSKSSNNTVIDNNASNNGEGIKLYKSSNNTVIDNKASNINGTGIWIWLSMNNSITGNNASNNSVGISLRGSSNNTITGNIANDNNFYGILIVESSDNSITGNTVSYNTYGIYPVYPSSRKTYNPYTGETNFSNNEHNGIDLSNSGNNKIYLNNFMNNLENVHPEISGNIWNSTEPLTYQYNNTTFTSYMGNFWSDYKGPDADGNGLGDTPYVIDSDEDSHPLMSRFENYLDICAKVWH